MEVPTREQSSTAPPEETDVAESNWAKRIITERLIRATEVP